MKVSPGKEYVVVSHRKIHMPSLELCASALAQISLAILSAFVP